jgi:transposase InsO family protein
LEEGFSVSLVCREAGLSHSTVTRWTKRYQAEGESGLECKRKHNGRKQISPVVKKKIKEVKEENPSFGVKRISQILRRMFFLPGSPETVRKTLQEEEKASPKPRKKPRRNITRPRFFERSTPNQLWQSDIFTFRLGGRYAYLIGYIDDYSRYIVGLGLYRSQTAEHVIEVYRRAMSEYNPPKEMLTDNGRQYTNWRGTTRFEKELKKEKVKHIRSQPHHPMTLGKIERFWKTIYQEFLSRTQFGSFESAQDRIRLWIQYYNHKRPHQGIKGLCPADRYFEIQSELKKTMTLGIAENVLEMALRGQARDPFYMVGRMEGQSVVLRAEKGKLKLLVDDDNSIDKSKEITYPLEQKNKGKNNDTENDKDGSEETKSPELGGGEVQGGAVDLDGTSETSGCMQRAFDQLGTVEPLAEPGPGRDAAGITASCESGEGTGVKPENANPFGEASGESIFTEQPEPAECTITENAERQGSREVSPGKQGEGLMVSGKDDSEEQESSDRGTGPETGTTDHAGSQRPDIGKGSSETTGSVPQDLLPMGTESFERDDGSSTEWASRATSLGEGPGERDAAEEGSRSGEEADRGGADSRSAGLVA